MFSSLCISGFLQFLHTAIFAVGYISGTQLFPEPLSSEEERIYIEKLKDVYDVEVVIEKSEEIKPGKFKIEIVESYE